MSDDLTGRLRRAVAAYPDASWWAHPDTLAVLRSEVDETTRIDGLTIYGNYAVPPGELWRVPEVRHSFIPKLPIGPLPLELGWPFAEVVKPRWVTSPGLVTSDPDDALDEAWRLLKRLHDSVPNDADNGEGD